MSAQYLSIYMLYAANYLQHLSSYVSEYLPADRWWVCICPSILVSTYRLLVGMYLPQYLSIYLQTAVGMYLPQYLSIYLQTAGGCVSAPVSEYLPADCC